MRTPTCPSLPSLRLTVLVLSLAICGAARAQAPVAPDPEAVRRLATDDPKVQAARWGTLALMAGKPWLTFVPGEIATVWRLATWVVPGASMRFQRGFCAATACQATDYVVQYDAGAGQLQFFDGGTMAYTGHVEPDGALRMKGTGVLGVLTAETLRHDPATGTLYANAHQLKAGTAQQLTSATGGFGPAVAAAAQASAPPVTAAAAAASAAKTDADLRAELESMKARVEQLSRQLEQQAPPAPAPARPLTAAEARAKAAEEKRQAEAKAREEKQAQAAEAQRQAAERKARAEEEKRAQAEARAREAEARAAEARRQADERRAREEAARRQAEEQRARQEAERREAAERAKEAEAARVREAQAAAARQQAAAQAPSPPPRPAVSEGPVRPGLYTSGTGYEVDVKVAGDALVLTERAYNRTSEYRPTSPGSRVYGYRNPNTGTHFALTVQDNTTLVASRFGGNGEVLPNGTPLRFAGGAAAEAQPVSKSTFTAMNDRAQHYLRLAQTDPANAQAWSFCGMAAMAQAHGQNEAQVRQAAMALKSIATTTRSPCGEVISDSLWRSLP